MSESTRKKGFFKNSARSNFFATHVLKNETKKPQKITKPKKELTGPQAKLNEIIAEATDFIFKSAETTVSTPFEINCVAFSEDNQTIFFGSSNGNLTRFDKKDGKICDDVPLGRYPIFGICLDEANSKVFVCGASNNISVHKLPRLEPLHEFRGHNDQVNQMSLSSNKEFLYSASEDFTVRQWSTKLKGKSEVILTHEGPARCLCVTRDNKYVFSGGDDMAIKIYDIEFKEEMLSLQSQAKSIWSLACNYSSTMLASGTDDGTIVIWNILDFTPITLFTDHLAGIRSLVFSPDDCFLASGSGDSKIKVWDLDKERREVTLTAHTGSITEIVISPQQDIIISASIDKNIKIWGFPRFLEEEGFKLLGNDFSSISFTPKSDCVISCGTDKGIRFWDPKNDEATILHKSYGAGLSSAVSWDEKYAAVGDNFGNLYIFDLKKKSLKHHILPKDGHMGPIRDMCFSFDSDYLVTGGGDSKIMVWHVREMENNILWGHQQSIWCVCISHDGETVASGSADKTLRVWNLKTTDQRYCIQAQEAITAIKIDKTDMFLITGGLTGTVKIWNIAERNQESVFDKHTGPVTGIHILNDNETFFSSSQDKTIYIYSLKYRIPLTFLTRKQPIFSISVSTDEKYLITGEHEIIYMQENPLNSKAARILGPEENVQKFLTYMKSLLSDLHPKHDPSMDDFIILPQFLNTLHFYTSGNHKDHLKISLSQNTAAIIPSRDGFHPLSICLMKELKTARDEVVNAFCAIGKKNPFILQMLEDDLIEMNKKSFGNLNELYNVLYQESARRTLPKFCDKSVDLPIVHISDHCRVKPEDFLNETQLSSQGMGISWNESYVRIPLIMGSADSIDFLESLADCTNLDVLRCEFVQEIIRYKWETAKYTMMYQGLMFSSYMILLCVYTAYYMENVYFQTGMFITNICLLCYECYQLMVSGASYFTDYWNYVDWARGSMMFSYIIIEWFDVWVDLNASVFAMVTILSWLRGITYFRLLTTTRYLINLIFQVVHDISGFLIVLAYSTLAFTFIFIVLERKMEIPVMLDYLSSSYLLVFGNFEGEDYNIIEWTCLTMALIIQPVIMLNLLIAIISDTYDRIQSDCVAADAKELIDLIIEVEGLMFTRREVKAKHYFQVCKEHEKETEDGGWEGQIRMLQASIDKINAATQSNGELAMNKLRQQDKNLIDQNIKLDQVLKSMKKS
ncbi:unnamed protein product [Blepharisma stoltei]|uniref:Ion transport domain-containing protein n=1 Tax=Blepharisma stoltei TaxID=1481888 RepID=A0AAU9K3K6_9CILI|nr:unnamed protein product [Blepharisma stoltei]